MKKVVHVLAQRCRHNARDWLDDNTSAKLPSAANSYRNARLVASINQLQKRANAREHDHGDQRGKPRHKPRKPAIWAKWLAGYLAFDLF